MRRGKNLEPIDESKPEFQPEPVLREVAKIIYAAEKDLLAEFLAAERRVKRQHRWQCVGEGALQSLIALGTMVDPRPSMIVRWPRKPSV